MFTDCPSCRRQFRIRAGQLSAAGGLVQCGFCGEQFNALERLRDRPLQREDAAGEANGGPVTEEPSFEIPETDHEAAGQGGSGAEPSPPGTHAAGRIGPAFAPSHSGDPGPDEFPDETPDWLLEEKPRAGRLSRYLWSAGILILLLALAAQSIWFNRDRLLVRWPQLQPWARQVCEYFQCDLIRNRDLSAIRVVNRDVRDHPRYRDALLVNATISNGSPERQPFPVVQLSLFDTAGNIIAYRRFRPEEYLDESIAIERGMQPQDPVHIVLEVTGPTRGAVSFEFRFLKQS